LVNIIVCVKQVLDPEAPVSTYQVDVEANCDLVRGETEEEMGGNLALKLRKTKII